MFTVQWLIRNKKYYTTVYYSYFVILYIIYGLGKLSLASKICPRPWPQRFVLGLGLGLKDLSSFNSTGSDVAKHTLRVINV